MSLAAPIVGSRAFHSPDTSNFGGGTAGTGPSSVSQRRLKRVIETTSITSVYMLYIYRDILKVSPQKMESLIPIVFGDDHVLFMVHLMRTSSTSSTWWVFRCRVWSPEGIWSAFWNHTILGGITPISSGGQCNLRSLQFVQTVIGYIRLYPMCSYFPLLLLCALPCKLPTTRWN